MIPIADRFFSIFRLKPVHMNKKTVQKIYALYRQKDVKAIIELQAENAEWSVAASPEKIPWANPGRGHKGVANFLKILGEWLVPEAFVVESFIEEDILYYYNRPRETNDTHGLGAFLMAGAEMIRAEGKMVDLQKRR